MHLEKIKSKSRELVTTAMVLGTTLMMNANSVICEGLFKGEGDAWNENEGFKDVTVTFCHWFPLFLILGLILFAATKDEKKKGIEKAFITSLIVARICCIESVMTLIIETLERIGTWL